MQTRGLAAGLCLAAFIFVKPYDPVYLDGGKLPYIKAFTAVIADFIGVEVTHFALHATYTFSVVQYALLPVRFLCFHSTPPTALSIYDYTQIFLKFKQNSLNVCLQSLH